MAEGDVGHLEVIGVKNVQFLGVPVLPQEVDCGSVQLDNELFEVLLLSFQVALVEFELTSELLLRFFGVRIGAGDVLRADDSLTWLLFIVIGLMFGGFDCQLVVSLEHPHSG